MGVVACLEQQLKSLPKNDFSVTSTTGTDASNYTGLSGFSTWSKSLSNNISIILLAVFASDDLSNTKHVELNLVVDGPARAGRYS